MSTRRACLASASIVAACVLAAATLGPPCEGAIPYTVTAAADLPLQWRTEAIYACARWNKALGRVVFEWRVTAPADIMIAPAAKPGGGDYLGYWITDDVSAACAHGGTVQVREAISCPEQAGRVIMHELGHAIGLAHSDTMDLHSVMSRETPDCGRAMRDEVSPALIERAKDLLGGEP